MNQRIKQARLALGLSQADFSQRLNLSTNYISLLECGHKKPSIRTVSDICREFNVNPVWLQSGTGEMFNVAKQKTDIQTRLINAISTLSPSELDTVEKLIDQIAKPTE